MNIFLEWLRYVPKWEIIFCGLMIGHLLVRIPMQIVGIW